MMPDGLIKSKASASEIRPRVRAARDLVQQSLNVRDNLRSRGSLDTSDEDWARAIAGEIAECDTALKE